MTPYAVTRPQLVQRLPIWFRNAHFKNPCNNSIKLTRECEHYSDFIRSVMTSQITGVSIVRSTVCWGTDQRKHQISASLVFVRGIHQSPVNSPHKGPVTRKRFRFDDVIMEAIDSYRNNKVTLMVINVSHEFGYLRTWSQYKHIVVCIRTKSINELTFLYINMFEHADDQGDNLQDNGASPIPSYCKSMMIYYQHYPMH